MRRATVLWSILGVLYAGFWSWYTGFGGPLTAHEIDGYMARMTRADVDPERLAQLRRFLEADTGDEFVMLNAIQLRDRPLPIKGLPAESSSQKLLERYMDFMMPALLARASHPVLGGPAAAAAIEVWGLENAESWSLGAMMRYRSRRDMMEIVIDPEFRGAHGFKLAAIEKTVAFPIDPVRQLGGPRLLVALSLLAVGLLLQLVLVRPREPVPRRVAAPADVTPDRLPRR